jgi:hypothetical protein
VLPLCFRLKPISRHQSIRAHRVDGPRRLFQRQHHLNCSDARRLSLARHGIRLASLRWRSKPTHGSRRRVSISPAAYSKPARRARWASLDWHHEGLASWKDGKLTHYPELAGQVVYTLLEDREGTVWAGGSARPTGRLCAIQSGSVQCYGEDGSFGRGVSLLYEDSGAISGRERRPGCGDGSPVLRNSIRCQTCSSNPRSDRRRQRRTPDRHARRNQTAR